MENIVEESLNILSFVENNAKLKKGEKEEDFIKKIGAIRGFLAKLEVKIQKLLKKENNQENYEIYNLFEKIAKEAYKEQYSKEFTTPEESLNKILENSKRIKKTLIKKI